ncbi:MAG TPA: hypothetical protein VHB50_18965, partial [Bryobacteraceae bacterium]|nr:hypothetical protein [Bryobacteraceae bacterium]
GRLYLEDGAIGQNDLSADGRHILPTDEQSWHLLSINSAGKIVGCTRYLQHQKNTRFDDLRVRHAALAESDVWGARLRAAVEEELSNARKAGFSYVEVGGWAMDYEIRCTAECLRSVLATYAWSRIIGGALGISTATERNGSASILRRLGGRSLEWDGAALPAYFDPHYNCSMQMLRFDSRSPNPRYEEAIEQLRQALLNAPVIYPERSGWQSLIRGLSSLHEPSIVGSEAIAHAI